MSTYALSVTNEYGLADHQSGRTGAWDTKKMKYCKVCQATTHTQFYCPMKPRKQLKTASRLIARKPINKIGKVQKRTAAAVAKWKRAQKPNHQGYYECYICHKWITYNMAEHMQSKVRAPELRTDPSNFRTVCDDCNREKGSLNIEDYRRKYEEI